MVGFPDATRMISAALSAVTLSTIKETTPADLGLSGTETVVSKHDNWVYSYSYTKK